MTVATLLATISSRELSEWAQYFEWKAKQEEEDRAFNAEVAKAQKWVSEGR